MTVLVTDDRLSDQMSGGISDAHDRCAAAVTPTVPVPVDQRFAFPGRPTGLAVAPDGTRYVSDTTSGSIWRIDAEGSVSVFLAPPSPFLDPADPQMRLLGPAGLAAAPDGTLVVADATGHRIWAVSPSGELHLLAGSVYGYRDGPSGEALFRHPCDVAIGPDGTCFVADTGNHRVRTITPDGIVRTLAGSIYDYGDGNGPHARFREPHALDVDDDGTCFVADTGNDAIRRITRGGEVTTLAGLPPGGDRDGVGVEIGLRNPTGLTLGHDGDLWVADTGNNLLRRIDRSGRSTVRLRFSPRRFPAAVASTHDGAVVAAATALDDIRRPQACLVTVGPER